MYRETYNLDASNFSAVEECIDMSQIVMAREIFGPEYLPYRQEKQM